MLFYFPREADIEVHAPVLLRFFPWVPGAPDFCPTTEPTYTRSFPVQTCEESVRVRSCKIAHWQVPNLHADCLRAVGTGLFWDKNCQDSLFLACLGVTPANYFEFRLAVRHSNNF